MRTLFEMELAELIEKNRLNVESNTNPDILAKFLSDCLKTYIIAVNKRDSCELEEALKELR